VELHVMEGLPGASMNSSSSAVSCSTLFVFRVQGKADCPVPCVTAGKHIKIKYDSHQDEDIGDCQLEQNLPWKEMPDRWKLPGMTMRLLCDRASWKCRCQANSKAIRL
jgi:hypothetical protein